MSTTTGRPRIGIALGGGSARGWAHIGVLSALAEHGLEPEIVCGTSIGALVGGMYAAGKLPELRTWVGALTRREVMTFLDFTTTRGGAISGRKLMAFYRRQIGDVAIEELPRTFAAVATDLRTGAEVWLQHGSLLDAIRASISLPGIFTPVRRDDRWLVDGGLVNPVPVSVCRALGAELVIAVDLHGGAIAGSRPRETPDVQPAVVRGRKGWMGLPGLLSRGHARGAGEAAAEEPPPSLTSVVATALDIMQARLSRSRLAGDPPDLLLCPRVRDVPPLEFAGGLPVMEEGYDTVRAMMPALNDLLGVVREPRGEG